MSFTNVVALHMLKKIHKSLTTDEKRHGGVLEKRLVHTLKEIDMTQKVNKSCCSHTELKHAEVKTLL